MKILIVGGDDALVSPLAEELQSRDFEVLSTHFGDGGLSLFRKDGPWEFVLADYRFIPGVKVKGCMQLVTAIHEINQLQQMAIMTAEANEVRRKLPKALQYLPVIRKPFGVEQVLRLLWQPLLPL
jgi:ActR/RegA family two-component response regulator